MEKGNRNNGGGGGGGGDVDSQLSNAIWKALNDCQIIIKPGW